MKMSTSHIFWFLVTLHSDSMQPIPPFHVSDSCSSSTWILSWHVLLKGKKGLEHFIATWNLTAAEAMDQDSKYRQWAFSKLHEPWTRNPGRASYWRVQWFVVALQHGIRIRI